jgi:hypothetical protein
LLLSDPSTTPAAPPAAPPPEDIVPSNGAVLPSATATLPSLPAPPSVLLGDSTRRRLLPLDDLLPAGEVSTRLDQLVTSTVTEARREGANRVFLRVALTIVGIVMGLRLAFDDLLPKIVLAALIGAVALGVVALALQALSEARRQRVLLVALGQVSRLARLDPTMRERLAPQAEAIVAALRAPSRVWPFDLRAPDAPTDNAPKPPTAL